MEKHEVYVTEEQLNVRLRAYEKLGSLDAVFADYDSKLRNFLTQELENKITAFRIENNKNIVELTKNLEAVITTQANTSNKILLREVIELCKTQIEAQSRIIGLESLQLIDRKMNDLRTTFENSIDSKANLTHKTLESASATQMQAFEQKIKEYQECIEKISYTAIQKAIDSQKDHIEKQIQFILHEQYATLSETFAQLKLEMMNELTKKIVDKKMVEDKLAEMESELSKRTQSIISFQIEQSRTMMEQSAKAEIAEKLKEASSSIFN